MLVGVEHHLLRPWMPNILLSHNPNAFYRAAEMGIDLTLAGHTHGGQIQVEILDSRLNPARFFTKFVAGLYQRPVTSGPSTSLRASEGRVASKEGGPSSPVTSHSSLVAHSDVLSAAGQRLAHLYVNRGLGTIGTPIRIGSPPEITLLVLRRA